VTSCRGLPSQEHEAQRGQKAYRSTEPLANFSPFFRISSEPSSERSLHVVVDNHQEASCLWTADWTNRSTQFSPRGGSWSRLYRALLVRLVWLSTLAREDLSMRRSLARQKAREGRITNITAFSPKMRGGVALRGAASHLLEFTYRPRIIARINCRNRAMMPIGRDP